MNKQDMNNQVFGSIIIAEHLKEYRQDLLHHCEMHLNLLKNSDQRIPYYLDIGIKIFDYKYNSVESITIFFPCKLSKSNIKDLGKVLIEKPALVTAIFNEKMDYSRQGEIEHTVHIFTSQIKNPYEKQQRSFILYTLADPKYSVDSLQMDEQTNTILTIDLKQAYLPQNVDCGNLYFRFRVEISPKNSEWFKLEENLSNDVLQAAFSKTELYDIRINDRRETGEEVLTYFDNKRNTLLSFKRVHFFFVTNVKDQVTNGTLEKMDTRMLEKDKWEAYFYAQEGAGNHPRIAYQWSKIDVKEEPFDNFEIFFRNTYDSRDTKKILLYLFVAFWIGSVGSSIANIGLKYENIPWVGIALVVLMSFIILCYHWKRKL